MVLKPTGHGVVSARDLLPDEKAWLLNLLSRDDLSETQDFCLNGLLLALSDCDDEQDPAAIHAKGEVIRLHLISSLQSDDVKDAVEDKTVIDPDRQ